MVQKVKVLVSSLQWLRLLLWLGFDPWPRNFHKPQEQPEKKKSKKKSVTLRKKVHITTEFVYIFLWKLDIKMGYINLQEDYCPTYEYSHSYTKDC